jgi:alpha/beta superfamily hydrolase
VTGGDRARPAPAPLARVAWIPGPAGPLEALFDRPAADCGTHAALFCHPHPQYGGTMHSKIVYQAVRAARDTGLPTLRFNFRGAGGSGGTFDEGRGEADDARAALDRLAAEFPGRTLVAGGFSFGAWMAVTVGARDPRVGALVSIGTPIGIYGAAPFAEIAKPILFVHGSEDPFGPAAQIAALAAALPAGRVTGIAGAGHLFTGREAAVATAVAAFLRDLIDSARMQPPGG